MMKLSKIALWGVVFCTNLIVFQCFAADQHPLTVRIGQEEPRCVELCSADQVLLHSPAEGLWSVATGWKNGWPDAWHHASPKKIELAGDWTIVSGELSLPQGVLELRDAYRPEGDRVRGVRRFVWKGSQELPQCTLSVRWTVPDAVEAKPLLPGILYYGNPSGAKTNPNAVAVHSGKPGDISFFEEHRFPIPFASIEWKQNEAWRGAALHTLPSPVAYANHADQWWSLGVLANPGSTELAILSGPCAANGKRSVVKALQREFLDYPDAWLRLQPGATIEKTFWLEAYPVARQGAGFQTPLHTALQAYGPYRSDGLPSYAQILGDKYRFACSRFRDRQRDPGFEMFPDFVEGTHYVMGWCGQSEAVPAALLSLEDRLKDEQAAPMAIRSLNHLAQSSFNDQGFMLRYTAETGKWSEQNAVSQGQSMESFARAVQAAEKLGRIDVKPWRLFLEKACTIHAARILREDWHPVSTAEAFFVSPLCRAYALFGTNDFRKAALKAAKHYADRHLDMTEPYWGGTLDASCEDKEGALAALQAFLAVYEMTKEPEYLRWAEHALDVAMTYTMLWNSELPPGRLRDQGFKTQGWTVVSVQNQHLDTFAVLFTPDIWRMGDYLKRDDLKDLAALMYRSCGQLIDPFGSQGEQIQQTNFSQQGGPADVFRMRGGYSEHWTVFWITAHFLSAAAQFEQMGIDLDTVQPDNAQR